MISVNPKYVTDKKGKKVSVILPMKDFKAILEELEELDDIRLFDEAKKEDQEFFDAEEVFKEIEESRKNEQV
ncbi:MAG: toxin-antitoxin system PhD family antidote component [Algoriphagus marincola HL-49]|jgi:hypothetical protein|uniref:Toxin-antitoxin system PhD family antidote component n=1 Tax=Algoriphagus marincola HL-49 TaxID=1305737 RepID=A0A0P7X4R0_9BACT|nr:hypothetical protein [Algoriphagus formosus]KPQ09789.1 MAG: toxin-antitoxin system PhD family antidote component [Algoriphagus marincola HL-49]